MINVTFCKRTKAFHCWQRDQFMETKATFIYIEMFIAYEHHFWTLKVAQRTFFSILLKRIQLKWRNEQKKVTNLKNEKKHSGLHKLMAIRRRIKIREREGEEKNVHTSKHFKMGTTTYRIICRNKVKINKLLNTASLLLFHSFYVLFFACGPSMSWRNEKKKYY